MRSLIRSRAERLAAMSETSTLASKPIEPSRRATEKALVEASRTVTAPSGTCRR